MAELNVLNMNNEKVGTVQLDDKVFGAPVKKTLIHEIVTMQLANKRQGTAATKTKGLVRGGGKKPWKQKKTGRARAGSNRSPLWVGGGTTFGPNPRDYSYKEPIKKVRGALKSALSAKANDGEIVVIKELALKEPKTKLMLDILNKLGLNEGVLILSDKRDKNVELASRNIPRVKVIPLSALNIVDLLKYKRLLMTENGVKAMKEVLG
ncbi:MAG: 50S ribosomal protein L4 [Nitrospirae bacterium RBG_19FT_COMBO_42_15]|nr:MAG: 50S ribosomal protein L4 [Nitrospirae bacterium RBG_19FT_COMBO_42_15]